MVAISEMRIQKAVMVRLVKHRKKKENSIHM